MPPVIFAASAIDDLQRVRTFLNNVNPAAAKRAAAKILESVQILKQHPLLGRPVQHLPDQYREWLIRFGKSGYVVLYRVDEVAVTVVAIRHFKEAGY